MAEYIEREATYTIAKKICNAIRNGEYHSAVFALDIMNWIDDVPAADVVPVVRCKDCKWCHAGYCEKYDDLIPFGCANKPWENWFCADGTKMDMEGE
jgi:hypothetical protein